MAQRREIFQCHYFGHGIIPVGYGYRARTDGQGEDLPGVRRVPNGPFHLTAKATPEAGGVVGAGFQLGQGDESLAGLAPHMISQVLRCIPLRS